MSLALPQSRRVQGTCIPSISPMENEEDAQWLRQQALEVSNFMEKQFAMAKRQQDISDYFNQ